MDTSDRLCDQKHGSRAPWGPSEISKIGAKLPPPYPDEGNIVIGTDTEVESDEEPNGEAPNVNLTEDSDTHRDSYGLNDLVNSDGDVRRAPGALPNSSANPTPAAPLAATAVPRNVDTTAAQVMAQPDARRRYRCGFCKMEGHNRKGCPHAQRVDTAPAPAPDDESDSDKSDNEDHYDDPDASNFTTRTNTPRYRTRYLTDDFKPYKGAIAKVKGKLTEFKRTHPNLYICEEPRDLDSRRNVNEKDYYWKLFDKKGEAFPFMECDARGDKCEGKKQPYLRSYTAVDNYLGWAIPEKIIEKMIERRTPQTQL